MKKRSAKLIVSAAALLMALAAVVAVVLIINRDRYYELTDEQAAAVLEANEYLTPEQRTVVEAAASLKGRVHYFWGGKSRTIGPDSRWGELMLVESEGSSMSGTVRPFGLDCSGFVTWAFIQINDGRNHYEMIGDGTRNQWKKSTPIEWSELRPGDLVFQNEYPEASSNHVGVCIGFYKGKPVFAHCSAAADNVIVTTAGQIFKYARRPAVFCADAP